MAEEWHHPLTGIPTTVQLQNFFMKTKRDINGPLLVNDIHCLLWTGKPTFNPAYPNDITYARAKFKYGDRTPGVHRFALFIADGYVDPGPTVDHLCYYQLCVEPTHLEGVSQAENNRRRRCVSDPYCKNRHLRIEENTRWNKSTGGRICLECTRDRDKTRYEEKYEKEKAKNTHTSEMRDFAAEPKLNENKVWEILCKHYINNAFGRALAREYQVSQPMIRFILNGSSWRHVYDKFAIEYPSIKLKEI